MRLLKKNIDILGGIILFAMFFIHGLINNLSFSYMGNSSDYAVDFIMNHFLSTVILFILKLIVLYILMGILLGVASHLILQFISEKTGKTQISSSKKILLNLILSVIIYIPFFIKDLIYYPQVYINGFYSKNSINKSLMDFMADNVNPSFFTAFQILIISLILALCLRSFINNFLLKNKIEFKNYILSIKGLATFTVLIIFITSLALTINREELNKNIEKPNVIILASDALRPDHLSGNGYIRKTSPNIDKLIAQGVSFNDVRIEIPRTFPSWVSFLTGQYASTHGIRHMFPTSMDINKNFKTIPSILKKHGYYTSVVADYAGDIFTRINLGFENIDAPFFNANYVIYQAVLDSHIFLMPFLTGTTGTKIFPFLRDSAYLCPPNLLKDRVIKSIKKSQKRPFFITTFFSSTHFPYAPPYPYYKKFAEKNYRGPFKFLKQQIISLNNNKVNNSLSTKDKKQVNALYDGGLNAFDDAIGSIIKFLQSKKIIENTIIVILSDHGENLYEDNLGMGHGEHFRGSYSTKVPFILSYDKLKKKGIKIKSLARQVDFAPTILDLLGEKKTEAMEGESLLPFIKQDITKEKRYAFGETGIWFDNSKNTGLFFQEQRIIYPDITGLSIVDFNFNNQIVLNDDYRDIINHAKHRYVYDGRYKLIYIPLQDKVNYELYDTLKDPQEIKNIANRDEKNLKRMKKELFKWITRNNDVMIKDELIFPLSRY